MSCPRKGAVWLEMIREGRGAGRCNWEWERVGGRNEGRGKIREDDDDERKVLTGRVNGDKVVIPREMTCCKEAML